MTDSFLQSEEFRENLRRIGPDSKFWYRSRLDPLSEEECRELCRRDREEWNRDRAGRTRSVRRHRADSSGEPRIFEGLGISDHSPMSSIRVCSHEASSVDSAPSIQFELDMWSRARSHARATFAGGCHA